jgi:putative photosynthetic complex assembly protein
VSTTRLESPQAEILPRRGVLLLGGLLLTSLGGVAAVRLSGWKPPLDDAPVLHSRSLHFQDQPNGAVAIVDAASGATLEVVHGEQGFLRGTLRGMSRERRRRGLDNTAPLQLLARADGRLTLLDETTGRRIDLESFGPTNAAVFARWLGQPLPAHGGVLSHTSSRAAP